MAKEKEATDADLEKSIKRLKDSVDSLDADIQKEISFWRSFLLAIVRGVGYAIGATIVASLVVVALTYIFSYARYIPILRDYVNEQSVKQILEPGTWTGQ